MTFIQDVLLLQPLLLHHNNNDFKNMKIFNYLILICTITIIVFNINIVNAESSLRLYLYNDNGTIRFDRFTPDKINIETNRDIYRKYDRESEVSRNIYEVSMISSNLGLEPIIIPINIEPGSFEVVIPYYEHIVKINILKNTSIIDSVDVSQYSTCNSNNICEYEKGEDYNTCIADCIGDDIQFSEETIRILQSQNGVIRDEAGVVLLSTNTPTPEPSVESETSSNNSNIILLVGGILFLLAGVGVFIWKLIKR
ncbi:MAG: hypothetical protein ACO3UU_04650, partial [Minisyncoccia bacterium]